MMGRSTVCICGLLSLLQALQAIAAPLNLATTYQGSTFFDGFRYNDSVIDYFNYGNVHYLGQTAALAANLTYINPAGRAVIKVDNTTSGVGDSTFGRNSVTLISNEAVSQGSLVVMDAVHLPYGCSVWPAFWMLNEATYNDTQGEIDIFEGVNDVTTNSYTLHTASGCRQVNSSSLPYANSTVTSTNCDHLANQNQGCSFSDLRSTSYGTGFASHGGGVYAMLWNADGIQSWFFERSSIPADLSSNSPDPSTWSEPAASWPAVGCNPSTFFTPQVLLLNINICGSFAGNSAVFAQTCSGVCTDLVAEPSNYDNAYFEINSIKVFNGSSTGSNAASQTVSNASGTATNQAASASSRVNVVSSVSSASTLYASVLCLASSAIVLLFATV